MENSLLQLDIIHILLSYVVKPSNAVKFNSQSYPIADHMKHVFNVSVTEGKGNLVSGSLVSRESVEWDQVVSSNDENVDDDIKELTDIIKENTENVNDIIINDFNLQFGIINGQPLTLIGCQGSTFEPSQQLKPYSNIIDYITLFYAVEVSVKPIPSQCITRGRNCSGGTKSIERSKVISYHISNLAKLFNFDGLAHYLKSRINKLCPILMMSNVSVCSNCFQFYSVEANQLKKPNSSTKEFGSATLGDQKKSIIVRKEKRSTTSNDAKNNTSPVRSSLPLIRPALPAFRIGQRTQSGLYITSDRSTYSVDLARRTYKHTPFVFVVPPRRPPERTYRRTSLR